MINLERAKACAKVCFPEYGCEVERVRYTASAFEPHKFKIRVQCQHVEYGVLEQVAILFGTKDITITQNNDYGLLSFPTRRFRS